MIGLLLTFIIGVTGLDWPPQPAGTIQGSVVNGSRDNQPVPYAKVVLRGGTDGEFVPVAGTKTDRYGQFVFMEVPLDPALVYLPGANHDGVHYPGQRVRLDSSNRVTHTEIAVFDAAETPSPLVATQHEIEVTVEEQVLKVTEALWISNPSRTTYVGQSMGQGPPVTFWLSIPKNFDRVTFDREFYGRRFFVVEHRPITEMPWLPGKQQLRFTYRLPLVDSTGQFRRTLDIPSKRVRIRVQGTDSQHVSCNLPRSETGDDSLVFTTGDEQLARDFTIELQIKSLPFPWMQYARWGSIVALTLLAGSSVVIPSLRRRRAHPQTRRDRKDTPNVKRAA